jgi:hypothetical protein
MLNKWLSIAGAACIAVPLAHILIRNQIGDSSDIASPAWTLPFAFIGPSLLLLAAVRVAAMGARASDRTADLTAGVIAIGQWLVTRIEDVPAFVRLLSDAIAIGGLILVLISLVVWWRTQGLRQ